MTFQWIPGTKGLMKVALPLMEQVLTQLAKNYLVPLGLLAAASPTDAAIQKSIFEFWIAALVISDKETFVIHKVLSFHEFVFRYHKFFQDRTRR